MIFYLKIQLKLTENISRQRFTSSSPPQIKTFLTEKNDRLNNLEKKEDFFILFIIF